MEKKIKIIIGGDTVPTKSNESFLINGQEEEVFNGVNKILLSADLAIVNLECPLTNEEHKINKAGPCLKANPNTINGLFNAGITVFSLANNHIMDYGFIGLKETFKGITEKHAFFTGAGENLQEARQFLVIERNGYKIAIISVAEHEFSIAGEDSPGANPFDVFNTIEDIRQASKTTDIVIVLFHGGIERYPYPSPNLQRICRKMVENGADFIICQHSHCIGVYEQYLDGHIVYGQGNLLFDYFNDELWQTGLLIEITLESPNQRINFIPVIKKGALIDLADDVEEKKIISSFMERSKHVYDKQFIQKEFSDFSKKREYYYLQTFLGFGHLLRKVDTRLDNSFTKFLFTKKNQLQLFAFINCESHLEVMKNFLLPDKHN